MQIKLITRIQKFVYYQIQINYQNYFIMLCIMISQIQQREQLNINHEIKQAQMLKDQTINNSIKAEQTQIENIFHNDETRRMNVALVSDFYFPFVGGVEIHINQMARLLSQHAKIGKVIVITHKYLTHSHDPLAYSGVKNHHGFRVYYLNVHYNREHMITYPTFIFNFRQARAILKQENIDIVHCHQSGSTLALEFIFYATLLGLRVLLTEHSLYSFRSISDIHFNRVSQLFLQFCDYVVAVSKTTRNNVILRAKIDPTKVVVIPNGVSDISKFKKKHINKQQSIQVKKPRVVRIVSVGRMTYRRGTDLLIEILPHICKRHDGIEILIIGDGVKRKALQKVVQLHQLQSKVKLLGIISDHEQLLKKMAECDIFLNTPLTQSFGIALAEAAMLGLYCVSTNVGGVAEAIPTSSLFSASTNPDSLLDVLSFVINKVKNLQLEKFEVDPQFQYPWEFVCQRTVQLYEHLGKKPMKWRKDLIKKAVNSGNFIQIFFMILGVIMSLLFCIPLFR